MFWWLIHYYLIIFSRQDVGISVRCGPGAKSEAWGSRPRTMRIQAKAASVSVADASCSAARFHVAGRLAPGNGDANKLLHQRDGHCDASATFLLENDSAFIGLLNTSPVE